MPPTCSSTSTARGNICTEGLRSLKTANFVQGSNRCAQNLHSEKMEIFRRTIIHSRRYGTEYFRRSNGNEQIRCTQIARRRCMICPTSLLLGRSNTRLPSDRAKSVSRGRAHQRMDAVRRCNTYAMRRAMKRRRRDGHQTWLDQHVAAHAFKQCLPTLAQQG